MTINHPAHRDLCSARYEHFRIELNKRKTYALQKGGCSGKFTLVQALVNKREEEYKLLTRNLSKEEAPSEEEFHRLGKEAWELAGMFTDSPLVHFYFKRLKD
jgi:hypothetical protein